MAFLRPSIHYSNVPGRACIKHDVITSIEDLGENFKFLVEAVIEFITPAGIVPGPI